MVRLLLTLIFEDENPVLEKSLNFVKLESRIPMNNAGPGGPLIIIVEWDEWGRASQQCLSWGLCNAKWFPQFRPTPPNGGSSLVELNGNNEYFFDILLAEEAPNTPAPLIVDLNIVLETNELINQSLTINRGSYAFTDALGEFGGYRIYMN